MVEKYNYMRAKLEAKGRKILGNPCAIMPVIAGELDRV